VAAVQLERVRKATAASTSPSPMPLRSADSEFVVLVGPSGAKIDAVADHRGLESPPPDGAYRRPHRQRCCAKDRDIAMVFQSYACIRT